MDILLRIIATFFKCLWRPKMALLQRIEDSYIVGLTEADLRFMGNARYFLFMEISRLEMMIRSGLFRIARRHGWTPLVASQTIRYKRPLKRFQKFKLKSRIVGWTDKWFFIEHVFKRNEKCIAFGMVKGCFLSKEGIVPTSMVFSKLGADLKSPELPQHFIDWDSAEQKHETSVVKELESNLDFLS